MTQEEIDKLSAEQRVKRWANDTNCHKLGYTKDDLFILSELADNSFHDDKVILAISDDDGTNSPEFKCIVSGDKHYMYLGEVIKLPEQEAGELKLKRLIGAV